MQNLEIGGKVLNKDLNKGSNVTKGGRFITKVFMSQKVEVPKKIPMPQKVECRKQKYQCHKWR